MAFAGPVPPQAQPSRLDWAPRPDTALAVEFRATPVGHHSAALTRLLRVLRSESLEGKHVVVCVEPHREYRIGRLSSRRGAPVVLVPGPVFDSTAAAEWAVFLRRWEGYFGAPLDLDAADRAAAGERS